MKKFDFQQAHGYVQKAKNILICTHANPDGDAIGSILGLWHSLQALGKKQVSMMVPNPFPKFLQWMDGARNIKIFEQGKKLGIKYIQEADLIFCLDFNDVERVGDCSEYLSNAKATKILIDHHPNPKPQFDILFSTTETSSTAELVYNFIYSFNKPELISKEAATALYVGIMTDTGSFSYLCNNQSTYLAVADLINAGVDAESAHRKVYDTYSSERLKLLGFALSERLHIFEEFHTAYIYLNKKDMDRFSYKPGDLEGVVNYPLSIDKVSFAVLFREQNGKIRLSLRSKGSFPVNEFAKKHFTGGGHRNAAGADSFLSMKNTLKKFEELLPQYKEELSV